MLYNGEGSRQLIIRGKFAKVSQENLLFRARGCW